jgi:hypothetical protein
MRFFVAGATASHSIAVCRHRVRIQVVGHRYIFKFGSNIQLIGPERIFLLDTGLVRRRAGNLRGSPLADVAYVSALTIVELVARIRESDKEFRLRRAAIVALVESNVQIDWQFPEAKIYAAFPSLLPNLDFVEDRTESLRTLVNLVCQASSQAELQRSIVVSGVKHNIDYFERYDEEYGKEYMAAGLDWARETRSLFEASPPFQTIRDLGLADDVSHSEYTSRLQGTSSAHEITLAGLVQRVMESQGMEGDPRESWLFAEYDGSIDSYIFGLSWWTFECGVGRSSSHNDAIDLSLLLYLVPGTHLVTTDRALATCTQSVGISVLGPDSSIVSNPT